MGIVELAFALLIGAALGSLAASGRSAPLPAWADLFAPGAMAWVCGVQGSLFRHAADYMLAFLAEGRVHPELYYAGWAVACVLLALVGSRMVQGVRVAGSPPARGRIAWLGGSLVAACSALLWPRLLLCGSTLEFSMGISRPLSAEPSLRLRILSAGLAALIPLVIAVGFVAFDGWRERRAVS